MALPKKHGVFAFLPKNTVKRVPAVGSCPDLVKTEQQVEWSIALPYKTSIFLKRLPNLSAIPRLDKSKRLLRSIGKNYKLKLSELEAVRKKKFPFNWNFRIRTALDFC